MDGKSAGPLHPDVPATPGSSAAEYRDPPCDTEPDASLYDPTVIPVADVIRWVMLERIEKEFTYHTPRPDQVPLYNEIRDTARQFAIKLVGLCPATRELDTALDHLNACVFFANAAIARHG